MKISRLELKNFRTFGHVLLQDLPDTIVLVSPNGRGKSSLLEAIAGAHDLVGPYHRGDYEFREPWQQRHVAVWPPHLPAPVKIGEHRAEVNIEVQAGQQEQEYLKTCNITDFVGKAQFVIEDGSHVTTLQANETIKRLFQYHNPNDGVGFVDYNRSVRFYQNRKLGNFSADLSDDRTKQSFMEFHRPYNQHEKFSSFKGYIATRQIDDYTRGNRTGEKHDSLRLFCEVFDHFFAPKCFVGCQGSETGGELQIVVGTPFGDHDTDCLSDGEKEVLHILAHLYRFRHLSNIVLWDTPELHLNAALESRLFDAIGQIAPANQYWIATHSLEFINSVPLDNIFVIRQDGGAAVVERASGQERTTRVAMYREMGAQVGLQLVSATVAFVEGKQAHSDKRILDRLVGSAVPGVNFIAGGSCENILSAGTKANGLLAEASANGDFLAIVDRDYREDAEVQETVNGYNGRLFMWNVHELENLFLDADIVHETLKYLDRLEENETVQGIQCKLTAAAAQLREWIAADWVAWQFHRDFQPPSRRIGGDNPKKSLGDYAKALRAKVNGATDISNIDTLYNAKLGEVDALINSGNWQQRLPGKQILGRFVSNYPKLGLEVFVDICVSTIQTKGLTVPEIERLKETIQAAPAK